MYKQNVALLNADGKTHHRWCAPKEIERLLKARQVRRIRDGKAVKYALMSYPPPSNSEQNAAMITSAEMRMLPAFTEKELKRIARACREPKPEATVMDRVKLIQRWMGHGLINRTPVTELIAEA